MLKTLHAVYVDKYRLKNYIIIFRFSYRDSSYNTEHRKGITSYPTSTYSTRGKIVIIQNTEKELLLTLHLLPLLKVK